MRPVTLFTGQWADVPLATLAAKAASWGYDGLELACWGDHFDVERAVSEVLSERKVRTADLGGRSSTREVGDAITARVMALGESL